MPGATRPAPSRLSIDSARPVDVIARDACPLRVWGVWGVWGVGAGGGRDGADASVSLLGDQLDVAAFQRLPLLATSWTARMATLQELYTRLPVCLLRARAAFAMALELVMEEGSNDEGEWLAFESLWLLDQSTAAPWLAGALGGSLGFGVRARSVVAVLVVEEGRRLPKRVRFARTHR